MIKLYSFVREIDGLRFEGRCPATSFEEAERIAPGEVTGEVILEDCPYCGMAEEFQLETGH